MENMIRIRSLSEICSEAEYETQPFLGQNELETQQIEHQGEAETQEILDASENEVQVVETENGHEGQEVQGQAEEGNSAPVEPEPEKSGQATTEQENDEADDSYLPFPCTLCNSKFQKKLFLNNHMERRHGIKFVFTERGKKVKLIRMPQEMTEGEKLDPCVEALLQQNGSNASNFLGVQPVEQTRLADACPTAHEVELHDCLQGKVEREFGAGILVKKIHTFAMKKAQERKQTPFVAYRPLRSKRLYLLSVHAINETMQLLIPAKDVDLNSCDGVEKEKSCYFTHSPFNPQSESSSSEQVVIQKPCIRFSNVAIVALAEQTLDENMKIVINVSPPVIGDVPMSLIKSVHFARTIIHCQPKRLRCLSIPQKPVTRSVETEPDTSRMKRKYTRRQPTSKKSKKDREKRRQKRKRVESSDDEFEAELELTTDSSSSEDGGEDDIPIPRTSRLRSVDPDSPIPFREHNTNSPGRCHPCHREVIQPPKKNYTRRGRPKKIWQSGQGLERKSKHHDDENEKGSKMNKSPRQERQSENIKLETFSGNEDDSENQNNNRSDDTPMPVKKRGRGRPRKLEL